jgi:hypothetical protein
MDTRTPYITIIEPVLEVTLICQGKVALWETFLANEGIMLPSDQDKVEIVLSAVEARYMGMKFRELSCSLRINETQVFLVHAFNSNYLFALAERTFFRTPYYHGNLAVTPHHIRLMNQEKPLLEATLPKAVSVTHCQEEADEWQILLPSALRKQPTLPHYFNARLEGSTRYYAVLPDRPVLFVGAGLPNSLKPLGESEIIVEKWLVRDRARHSKSQTFTRK